MIVLFSSFMSPHMKPLCDALYEKTGGDFRYVATSRLTEERRKMGYAYGHEQVPYLLELSDDIEQQKRMANEADCVIINVGSANCEVVRERVLADKLTFLISERIFKRGALKLADPALWKLRGFVQLCKRHNVYLLCMGAFVAKDFSLLGFSRSRAYRFGYFPALMPNHMPKNPNNRFTIVWAGRMINWKRPHFALKIAKGLSKRGIDYEMHMLGDGAQYESVHRKIAKSKHLTHVKTYGMQPNDEVRRFMRHADVFLFTSTKREGWGAVMNESLNAETPVVASDTIGAAPYLIENGKNGYTFRTRSVSDAIKALEAIAAEKENPHGRNVSDALTVWNEKVAAERLLLLIRRIHDGTNDEVLFEKGPISPA